MVKSYDRYDQEKVFGVISSQSNILWLPPSSTQSSTSLGRAISSALEEIIIWDIKTGEILQKFRDGLTPGASNASSSIPPSSVVYLTFHAETNILASGYADGSIKLWDLTSGEVLINFTGHKSGISLLKFDRSGTRLVSGSQDSSIIIWDLVGEEGLFKLKGHKSQITGLFFLSAVENDNVDEMDDYLLSCSKDGLIKLWELKSQQCVETHLAHSNECWAMGLNSNQDLIVTSGNKDQVKVWSLDLDSSDGDKIKEVGKFEKVSKSKCNEISFKTIKHNELFYLQNSDRTIEVFRIRSEDEIKKGISKRSKRLKEKGYEEDEILQNIHDAQVSMMITPFTTVRTTSKIKSCSFIIDSKRKNKLDILISLMNNSIEYHNIPIPENLKKSSSQGEIYAVKQHTIDLLGHRNDIRSMDVSSDNKLLATASNGELKVWNIKTNNVIRTFVLEGGYALCCRFLPGGTMVVVGFKNGDLELYDLTTSSLLDKVEQAHKVNGSTDDEGAAIWSLDLTPDGKTLITGGNDKSVKFWNFKVEDDIIPGTKEKISRLRLAHAQTLEVGEDVLCVKVSPDGRLLAMSLLNNNVQVIFIDSMKLFLTLYGHKLPVLSIDISQDSKLIITSSADKNIKIWGLDFGDCHKSIFGHQDSVMNVKFIGESHNFFSSGKDGLIKYWDGDKFECIQKLAAHQSEVWCLAISSDGEFMVSTSHDHSIRLWSINDDQVFLEEEREKEMDELYENNLIDSLETDEPATYNNHNEEDGDGDEDINGVEKVTRQTMETLKAGERLMEALDVGIQDIDARQEYLQQLKIDKANAIKPDQPIVLSALNLTAEQYVLKEVLKIKTSQLDDALLVLPFSYSLKLLRMIEIWTNEDNITGNVVNMSLICRLLFFVIRNNARELIGQKDPHLRNQLIKVKQQLRNELTNTSKQLGVNTQGLKFIKQQWKLNHETEFIDEQEQRQYDDSKAIKRTYATVV